MKSVEFSYCEFYQILICIEHEYALQPSGVELHLRRQHALKGSSLRAVLDEIAEKGLILRASHAVQQPSNNEPKITGLSLLVGYHCLLSNCNQASTALSQCRRTVEKHQAQVHGVSKRKPDLSTTNLIGRVSMQSFFPRPHYRPFIVQTKPVIESNLSACNEVKDVIREHITGLYDQSQKDWASGFEKVASSPHKSQTPPWLQITGISTFLSELNKDALRKLMQSTACDRLLSMRLNLTQNDIILSFYRIKLERSKSKIRALC